MRVVSAAPLGLCLLTLLWVVAVRSSNPGKPPPTAAKEAPKLGSYNVTADQISVSGISSGGFMAVQFHVAFSKTIMGAGITAGGPFFCAQDNLLIALTACSQQPQDISVEKLVDITYATAATATIDPPKEMKGDGVFLISGTNDSVVVPGVMKKLEAYYSSFGTRIQTEFSIPAKHSQITDDYGNACDVLGSPFINNCRYPSATHVLQFIYEGIQPDTGQKAIPSNLLEYDQSEFFADVPELWSMDSTGYVYVPSSCQDLAACRLHIVFHGCEQGRRYIGDVFAMHAGYNAVAEVNHIIVLYPQATNSTLNPKGCWDWWGYTGPYYACKLGVQMAGVKLMLDRVAGV